MTLFVFLDKKKERKKKEKIDVEEAYEKVVNKCILRLLFSQFGKGICNTARDVSF